jgi:tetratricopeptide (TPR) repeat protein
MPDTVPDVLNRLKETCAFISGPDGTGTGYLIAPQRLATALHVVKSWREGERHPVVVGIDGQPCEARVIHRDPASDAAVLAFEGHITAAPLPLAKALERMAEWEAYGFPATAGREGFPTGLSISGHVQDPSTRDDAGHAALLLFSQMIAAGNASPLHGFSGSPVLVHGAVVGHLTKHLGDPDDRRRAAYGLVYACPVRAVQALLDIQPTLVAIAPPKLTSLSDLLPQLPKSEYHVFVSYRSTDREWAMSLVARLEDAGFHVFIDQRELVAGEELAEQLQSALQRSRAAVVLVSRGWLESGWCQAEANVLLKRASEDKGFKLIPLRLDDSAMPPLFDARLWLDFRGISRAEGPNVERLLYGLIGRPPPSPDSAAGRVETAVARVVDDFVAEIKAAARNDPSRVLQVLERWRRVSSADVAPVVAAAEVLIGQSRPDLALAALDGASETLRVRQLRAFALRKNGDIDQAVEILEQLYGQGELDPETGGLLAGSYKARWLKTGDRAFLQASYEVYRETYERTGDPFNGINTAAMALHCGDRPMTYQVAAQVRDLLLRRPPSSLTYWDLATLGEAQLLLDRFDDAREWYRKAAGAAAGRHQDIAVMRRQARLNLKALKLPRDRLDVVLPVPRVLAYTGHMVDADDRPTPRFPREKVGRVRQAIQQRLSGLGPLYGFGTAARGSDILFLETLLERDYGATVVLPFPAAEFLAVSGGGRWNERFQKIQANPRVELQTLKSSRPADPDLPGAFADANREVQRRAVEYAKRLDETPVIIAVWDGKAGDGPGGTADAVALWREDGYDVEVIDLTAL